MKLRDLAALWLTARLTGDGTTDIVGIQMDSRRIQPGDLFVCLPGIPGVNEDRLPYVGDAESRGAAALLVEKPIDSPLPQLIVKDTRAAMSVIAAHLYGYPSREMKVIGVTGTKGKTTTSHLIEKILRDHGLKTGLMGNLGMRIGDEHEEYSGNTQDSPDLQRSFRKMAGAGTDFCVMEASSQGLDLERVRGVQFRTAVFTNLTLDHLDYHQTMEAYQAAKGLLFSRLGNALSSDPNERCYAVLNADDAASQVYRKMTTAEVIMYGFYEQADVRASQWKITPEGTEFEVSSFAGSVPIRTSLVGKFNVYNCLAAIAACLIEGVPLEEIKRSLEAVEGIPGRMELVKAGQSFTVLVDYAHTPDSLENVLATIREFAQGSLITVFGCGGDRDRTKRPVMGGIAARYSDYILVTSDNPRTEDPDRILQEIHAGLKEADFPEDRYEMIMDRKEAIIRAIEVAGPWDIVLIAGKGHETYQIIGKATTHFDDREVAREAIRHREDA